MPFVEDQARSIFFSTLERPSDQWNAFLTEACGADEFLRGRVTELLRAHGSMASINPSPSPTPFGPDSELVLEGPGAVLGPYRLLEKIGEGGFGIVYMAEQTQPVRRKVALKILKPGMDTRQVVARFEAERQALALMDHPNIAQVFDGGATATGRPYFVMELVRGIPITEFCDENVLPVRKRLDLFLAVCQAVQHAHQKGIIHRDLKPSNVMVTLHDDVPVVKVIDFGIAKAVGQQLTEKTLFTNFAQMIGTPPYMSPEQAQMSGLDVDTRSDIYALGVLLYELLTGSPPFDRERLRTVAFDEIRRIIREEEPPKPSTRLNVENEETTSASRNRGSDPRKLSQLLRGELDWIVMKCLEKDRNRRYETANGLANDLHRYLHDEPVHACPPSVAYRLRLFTRRHKASLSTAALVLVLVIVAGSLAVWQSLRATAARDSEIRARLDLSEAKQSAAEERANRIANDLATLNTANRLIESGGSHADFSEWALAESDLTAAVKLRPDHSQVWFTRGAFYARLSLWDLAASDFQSAFQLNELGTANSLYLHALLRRYIGDEAGYRLACEQMIKRFGQNDDPRTCDDLARTCLLVDPPAIDPNRAVRLAQMAVKATRTPSRLANLGTAEYRAGQYEFALEHLAEARALNRYLETTWMDSVAAMAQFKLGQTEAARKSLKAAADSLALRFQTRLSILTTYNTALWPYEAQSELHYREASRLINGKQAPDDDGLWTVQAETLAAIGRSKEALARFDRATELNPKGTSSRTRRANYYARLGDWEHAIKDYENLHVLAPANWIVSNNLAWYLVTCPDQKLRDPKRALELATKAVAVSPSAKMFNTLALANYRNGDWTAATKSILRSMQIRDADDAFDWILLGMAQWRLGHKDRGRALFNHAVRRIRQTGTGSEEMDRFREEAAALLGVPPNSPSSADGTSSEDPSAYTLVLEIDPAAVWAYERRGNACARLKQWDQAAADLQRATENDLENSYCWYSQAAAHIGGNNLDGYRLVRAKLLERHGRTTQPGTASHLLYISVVLPAQPAELDLMLRMGDLSAAKFSNPRARGAANYRAGRYQAAINDLNDAAKVFPPRGWDWLFLAMAYHQLGNNEAAKTNLEKAVEWIERMNRTRETAAANPWIGWQEPIEVDQLLREARAMIQK